MVRRGRGGAIQGRTRRQGGDRARPDRPNPTLRLLGCIGGIDVDALLKVIGTGIKKSLESNFAVPLLTPAWLICLCGLISCAVIQLSFLHRTLANSPVSYGVPTY